MLDDGELALPRLEHDGTLVLRTSSVLGKQAWPVLREGCDCDATLALVDADAVGKDVLHGSPALRDNARILQVERDP